MSRRLLSTGLASLLLLTACASQPVVVSPANQASAHFQEGEAFFEQGYYQDAITSWEKVRQSYYSPDLNILAEMMIAEAYFADEKYVEAAVAYEAFLKNNPEHAKAQDALYRLGLANMRQMLDHDQDQMSTRQALATFRSLLQRYPQEPRKAEVLAYIDHCLYQLAAHEMMVGKYYLKTGQYQAAIKRFEGIVSQYPGHHDQPELYYYLGQASLMVGDKAKSDEAFSLLFNRFPQSEYVAAAEKFMRKNL